MNLGSPQFLIVLITGALSWAVPSFASSTCSSVFETGEYTEATEHDAIEGLARMKISIDEALAYRDTMSPGMIKKMQQTYAKKMQDFLALSKMDEATFKKKITESIQRNQEKEISVDEKVILEQKKLLGEIVSYTATAPVATGIPFSYNLKLFEYLPGSKQALIFEQKNLFLIDITNGNRSTITSDAVAVKVFADRKRALILTRNNKLIIMNLRSKEVLKEFTTSAALIDGAMMDINPSQSQALIMALYGKAYTLDLQTGEEKLLALPPRIQMINWSKKGEYINDDSMFFASNSVVAKLDLKTGLSTEKNILSGEHQDFVISNDGLEFLIFSSSSMVSINEKLEMTSEVKSYKDPKYFDHWEIRDVKRIPNSPDHISLRLFHRKTSESKILSNFSRSGFKFVSPIPAETPNESLSFADTGEGLLSLELDSSKQYIIRLWK